MAPFVLSALRGSTLGADILELTGLVRAGLPALDVSIVESYSAMLSSYSPPPPPLPPQPSPPSLAREKGAGF